jgi:hypothetical protein
LDAFVGNYGGNTQFFENTAPTTPVNNAPVAVNDSATTAQNTQLTIATTTLIANDSDVDSPNSSLQITGVSGATNGTAVLNNNGTPTDFADDFITFTPTNGFSGNASFNYTLSDGSLTSTATVEVAIGTTINGGNNNDTLEQFTNNWSLLMAAVVIATMPVILLFLAGQRQFIQGIATTGIKN